MTKEREALKMALEALERYETKRQDERFAELITAIKEALTQLEPTPEQLAALGWQSIECPFCGTSGARAFPKPEQEPNGYVQTVIEALYENGDPVSVDAAELLQRITAQPEQATGWDNGLSQDYDKKLGAWFSEKPNAKQELREAQLEQCTPEDTAYRPGGIAQLKRPQNCGTGFCSCIECVMAQDDEDAQALSDRDMGDS